MHQYEQYSSDQLAMDSKFQEWVLRPTEENENFWQGFMLCCPQRRMALEEAIDLVRHAGLTHDAVRNADFLEGWSKIERAAGQQTHNRWVSYAAAAIFTLAAASTLYFVIFNTRDEQFHTAFGETRRISLSDGSNVVLNANSTLTLNDMDPSAGSRSVTLDGTAWFEVIHTPDNRPFIVRTAGEVDVHVLGTTFEVGQKNGIVEVFLKSGKVKVVSGDHESVMRPGQIAVASRVGITLAESSVDAVNARFSWVAGQYVMNESTLEQVAAHILEHFGKRVAIDDPALLSTTVSGKVPANDLPVLLEVLKQTLHLRIRETDGTLYIRRDIGADVK